MQQAVDRNTLDRLMALGRKQGHLTTADLRASLPVETMSAEEIALIVAHLEDSGVAVELEDALLYDDPKPRPVRTGGAQIIPFPGRSAMRERIRPKPAPLQTAAPAPPKARTPDPAPRPGRAVHWTIAAAGLLVLLVSALLILTWGG